jgi:hypothetical protein
MRGKVMRPPARWEGLEGGMGALLESPNYMSREGEIGSRARGPVAATRA